MKNVLVFPCGSEIGLEVNRALKNSKHFKLYGASSVNDHGKYVYKNYIPNIPFIDSINFIDDINKVIKEHSIDFIIPAHDSAVLTMAENKALLNAEVLTSCVLTCRICRSKRKTYEVFDNLVSVPYLWNRYYLSCLSEISKFPVFLKPDVGQGSKGTCLAHSKEEVAFYLKKDPSLLILEYLPGKEYTVDCFTDRNGELLFYEGRERARICNGISMNSIPVNDVRFKTMAETINTTLSFQGAWFYQVKERNNGDLVLMEIAPRIAGTSTLFRANGVNFIQLSLFDMMGVKVSILKNDLNVEIDRALYANFSINKKYDYVYIDFDDTIIVNGLVNAYIIKFIYQSKNKGKKVILLSKHKSDIKSSLEKYSISESLFDNIIILKDFEKKSSFITNLNSIFVDDSFSERKDVFDTVGIPVFDIDAVEELVV